MSSDNSHQNIDFQLVRTLYFRMLDIDESLQESFLNNAHGFPIEVRKEVADLLDLTVSFNDADPAVIQEEAAQVLLHATAIDEYRILGVLGRGGMGVVYHAESFEGKEVAVKVLSKNFTPTFASQAMAQESAALKALDHPGISKFIASGTTQLENVEVPYIVTQYVPGESLRKVIERNEMTRQGKIQLLIAIGNALGEAHKHGVTHCDLKPENILLNARGMPCIIDFGLSRLRNQPLNSLSNMNHDGQVVGTLQYMSPEQLTSSDTPSDHRLDIYSLGVIAFELLTGRLPYDTSGASVPEAVAKVAAAPHKFTRSEGLTRADRIVLNRALEKHPQHRYQSCEDLVSDLGHLLLGDSPLSFWKQRAAHALRGSRAALPIATIVLVVASLLVVSSMSSRQDEMVARQVCHEITVLDDVRHDKHLETAAIHELIPAYEKLLIRSIELPNTELAEQLARYIYFRCGELHYFLAQRLGSREEYERAAQCWIHSTTYLSTKLHDLVPLRSLAIRMNGVFPHVPYETLGLAYTALADYEDPLEYIEKSKLYRGKAWDIFYNQSADVVESGKTSRGHLHNNLGRSFVALGELTAAPALVDSGITLLSNEYRENNLQSNWDARSYAIHHLAKAHFIRAQLNDSLEDLDQAEMYANEALERRGNATQGQERAFTLALLAECEAFRIDHGITNISSRITSTSTLLAAADTILNRGNVRSAAHLKISAAKLLLAEGKSNENLEQLEQAAQITENCQRKAESIELIFIAATAMALRAEVAAAQFEITGESFHRKNAGIWSSNAAALIPRAQSAPLHASVNRARRILD